MPRKGIFATPKTAKMSKRFTDKFDFGVIYLTLELKTQPKVGLVKLKFMFEHFLNTVIKIMKFDQNYSLNPT